MPKLSFTQNEIEYVPPSPESASLISQMDVGNSYSSGAVNVNLPLYTIQGDLTQHPVSASYTSNGFKVEEEASRLGLGWRLNVGGTITRIVRGLPDEHLATIGIPDDTQGGSGANVTITGFIQTGCTDDELYSCDMLPDLFYYSIPGGPSGKFALKEDGTVHQMPYNNVEISFTMDDDADILPLSPFGVNSFETDPDGDDMIVSFTIKDENGMTYTFQEFIISENYSFQTYSHSNFFGYWLVDAYTSSWELTKIYNISNNEEITFEYDGAGVIKHERALTSYDNASGGPICRCPFREDEDQTLPVTRKFQQGSSNSILKTINWRYGKIEFLHESRIDLTNDKHFSSMAIYDKDLEGNFNYRSGFDFEQSYFTSAAVGIDQNLNRLKLDAIQSLNRDGVGTGVNPYNFTYNTQKLPPKRSLAKDIWGYSNGKPSTNGIPELWFYTNDNTREALNALKRPNSDPYIRIAGDNRTSDLVYAEAALLHKVTYPTGGVHTYDYELHSFKYNGLEYVGGGVRVKSLSTDDKNGNTNTINYTYEESDNSTSGYAVSIPSYGHFCYDINVLNSSTVNSAVFRSSTSFTETIGQAITYSRTKEEISGNGYTVYEFTSAVDYPDTPPLITELPSGIGEYDKYPFLQCTSFAHKRELPTSISHYNSTDVLISQIINTFKFSGIKNFNVKLRRPLSLEGASQGCYSTAFRFMVEDFVYKDTEIKMLDGVSTLKEFNYDLNHYKLRDEIIHANNDIYRTKYTYPFDNPHNNYGILNIQKRLYIVTSETFVGTHTSPIDGMRKSYDSQGPFINEVERYEVTWDASGTIIDNGWQTQIEYLSYDINKGKPTSIKKDGWQIETLEWNGLSQLKTRTFETDEWQYYYDPDYNLITTVINPDLTSTVYAYDDFNRLEMSLNSCRNAKATIDYVFPSSGFAYIETTKDYPTIGSNTNPNNFSDRKYIDGLGKPIQNIRINQHPTDPSSSDIVTAIEYDHLGRTKFQYEPTSHTPTTVGDIADPSIWPKTETTYYDDPLNRPKTVTPPRWHATSYDYSANSLADKVIRDHSMTTDYYPANELYKVTVKDGNLNRTITFTDKLGRVVLKRRQNGDNLNEMIDTYTLYDDKHRVTTIIPPDAEYDNDNLIYKYTYSGDDLTLTKDLPDSEKITYTYNSRDLIETFKDGYFKNLNQKYRYKYDVYGNILSEGISFGSSTFYTTLLKEYTYGTTVDIEKNKMLTSKVRLLGTSDFIDTKYVYDDCGRIEQVCQDHMLNQVSSSPTCSNSTYTQTFNYDSMDNILSHNETIKKGGSTQFDLAINYDYDHIGREKSESMSIDGGTPKLLSGLEFTVKEQIRHILLGSTPTANKYLQDVLHEYNDRGFLQFVNGLSTPQTDGTEICETLPQRTTNPVRRASSPDLFKQYLGYISADCNRAENISIQSWQVSNKPVEIYGYEYDYLDRIRAANYGTFDSGISSPPTMSGEYNAEINYENGRGNLSTIKRKGFKKVNNGFISGTIDDLSFSYFTEMNRIKKITDNAAGNMKTEGYNPKSGGNYSYTNDGLNNGGGNGNILVDPSRQATFTYNHLNLPNKITLPNGNRVEYVYDADGNVHQRLEKHGSEIAGKRNYIGHFEFADNEPDIIHHKHGYFRRSDFCSNVASLYLTIDEPTDKTYRAIDITSKREIDPAGNVDYIGRDWVEMMPDFSVPLGTDFHAYISPPNCNTNATNDWLPHYIIRDHLGNNRVTFADLDGDNSVDESEIVQESHYYPFGLKHTDPDAYSKGGFDYLYNGKELQKSFDLDYYDFGARFYDPSIGRWTSVDPLAHQFPGWNPYHYVHNNPINMIDPTGMSAEWVPGVDDDGNITLTAEAGDNASTLIDFFGGEENASQYVDQWALNENVHYSEGSQVKLKEDNPFSLTMKHYSQNSEAIMNNLSYDCKELCRQLVLNETSIEHTFQGGHDMPRSMIHEFGKDWAKKQKIDGSDHQFGKTFSYWSWTNFPVGDHAAIYFGQDKGGTSYWFSKNGVGGPLKITTMNELGKSFNLWNIFITDYKKQ